MRNKGKTSVYYSKFKAACDEIAMSGAWTTSNGETKIAVSKSVAAAALA
jgi:hypothetical protein